MEARVKILCCGDRTWTSCTRERKCVGDVNALTNWASRTDVIMHPASWRHPSYGCIMWEHRRSISLSRSSRSIYQGSFLVVQCNCHRACTLYTNASVWGGIARCSFRCRSMFAETRSITVPFCRLPKRGKQDVRTTAAGTRVIDGDIRASF